MFASEVLKGGLFKHEFEGQGVLHNSKVNHLYHFVQHYYVPESGNQGCSGVL
jgi:hypothetical protein